MKQRLYRRELWNCRAGAAWEWQRAAVEEAMSAAGLFHRPTLESVL